MFTQISSRDFNENKINECRIVAAPVAGLKDFPFCSDLIILDEQNMLGIEFNWDVRIRIDAVIATDTDSFVKMMDALIVIALRYGYNKLYFADEISEDILEMFMYYGFVETQVHGDIWNHYLSYTIDESEVKV